MSDGSHAYYYDAEHHLVQVDGSEGWCQSNTGTAATACYTYDAEGRRIRRSVPGDGITDDYLYDLGGHFITQVSSSGFWVRGEIYANGEHIATYENDLTTPTTFFMHGDHLGTERVETTVNGSSCETITNTAFGDGLNTSGSCDPTSLRFTGKMRDFETNLDNFGARFYSNQLGRFMSSDEPFAGWDQHDPQSFNLFSYVGDSPLSRIDADGHDVQVCVDRGIGVGQTWTCFDLTDKQYQTLFNQQNGSQGINLPGGKFPSGSITCGGQVCGSAQYLEPVMSQPIHALDLYFLGVGVRGLFGFGRLALSGVADLLSGTAEKESTVVIGKLPDLAEYELGTGERTLDLSDLGDPQTNWAQNSSKLREAMSEGNPIKDVSAGKAGSNTGFLRAERNLLENHGWTLQNGYWYPPNH